MDRVERARELLAAELKAEANRRATPEGGPSHGFVQDYIALRNDGKVPFSVPGEVALRAIEAALPNPVSDTRDLGIQEERDIRPAVLEVLRRHRSTGESQEVIARDITTAVRAVLHGSTIERDTVGGEAVRKAKAAMSPLVDEDMPEPMRDAWLTDLAVAALSATPEKGV